MTAAKGKSVGCRPFSILKRNRLAMRKFVTVSLAIFAVPCIAYANPVVINPASLLAFWVVVFFALVVEAGISALVVTFSGMSPLRVFFGFLVGNAAIYLFAFRPLLEQERIPLTALEFGVLAADAAVIKFLSGFEVFQSDSFTKLSWWRALMAAGAGNAFSYFIGRVASNPF